MAAWDIVIVGGGQAARRAAEGARAASPDLSIVILGEEPHAPYDRPSLSKGVLETGGDLAGCEVRTPSSYADDRIDLRLGQRVDLIVRAGRAVRTLDGDRIGYGRLILATGSRARTLPVPTSVADRVLTLRTRDDAVRLAPLLTPGARVAIIGAGFIGLEVASSALVRGAKPVVIEAGRNALGRALPGEVADRIVALHRAAGVEVRLGETITGMESDPGGVVRLNTPSGTVHAEVVVVGVGVVPNTELAEAAGLDVDDGVLVQADGSTSDPHVFAAGEVARHPVLGVDKPMRLESWQVAELQADAAGRTAAGDPTEHRVSPWFWSDQLGCNLQMLGHVPAGVDLIRRDLGETASAWFALGAGGRLVGAITLNAGREIALSRRLIAKGVAIPPDLIRDLGASLRHLLV